MTSCLPLFDHFQERGRLPIEGRLNPSSPHPVHRLRPASVVDAGAVWLVYGEKGSPPWSGRARVDT